MKVNETSLNETQCSPCWIRLTYSATWGHSFLFSLILSHPSLIIPFNGSLSHVFRTSMLRILVFPPIRISYFTSGISTRCRSHWIWLIWKRSVVMIELLSGQELDSFKIDEVKNGEKGDSGARLCKCPLFFLKCTMRERWMEFTELLQFTSQSNWQSPGLKLNMKVNEQAEYTQGNCSPPDR